MIGATVAVVALLAAAFLFGFLAGRLDARNRPKIDSEEKTVLAGTAVLIACALLTAIGAGLAEALG